MGLLLYVLLETFDLLSSSKEVDRHIEDQAVTILLQYLPCSGAVSDV